MPEFRAAQGIEETSEEDISLNAQKKRPSEGCHLRAAASWACAEDDRKKYYTNKIIIPNSRKNASPNLDGGGGALPVSGWVLALTMIGTGWLTGQLFRLIDWIER